MDDYFCRTSLVGGTNWKWVDFPPAGYPPRYHSARALRAYILARKFLATESLRQSLINLLHMHRYLYFADKREAMTREEKIMQMYLYPNHLAGIMSADAYGENHFIYNLKEYFS